VVNADTGDAAVVFTNAEAGKQPCLAAMSALLGTEIPWR
jgi:hypothetical protein